VIKARDEEEHIDRPFREINWRKLDKYRAKGLSWLAISIPRGMDIPYNTLRMARHDDQKKKIESLRKRYHIRL